MSWRRRRATIRPRAHRVAELLRVSSSALPNREVERHSSWLEVFFDLIFALALASLVNRLHDPSHPEAFRVLGTFGLFAIVWWAWGGQAYYDTRFDPDDVLHRLSVLLAMVGAGAMAVGAVDAPHTLLLPIGYLVVRGVLIVLYARVRHSTEAARKLTDVYLVGFGLGWLLWLGSLAAPTNVRPVLWIVGTAIEFATPWLGRRRLVKVPVDPTHLPERVGLFTIIVLGVSLTGLLNSVPERPAPRVIVAAALAFVIPASVWWVYITYVNTGLALRRLRDGLAYAYVHAFLTGSLLLLAWALAGFVRHTAANTTTLTGSIRLVLALALGIWMLCGLALNWISLGFVPSYRIIVAVIGLILLAVTAIAVDEPLLSLALFALVLIGYAVAVSRYIVRASGARGP